MPFKINQILRTIKVHRTQKMIKAPVRPGDSYVVSDKVENSTTNIYKPLEIT